MDQQRRGWLIASLVVLFLIGFAVKSGASYVSDLKQLLANSEAAVAMLRGQLDEKNKALTDLEGRNTSLTSDLESERRELSQRLDEVRKLQGSVKTVGRCLLGVTGVIAAIKQDNAEMARKSVYVIDATCQESYNIIKQVEGFGTTPQ